MEGKKIAFIVVAIATIGGIAYYLNKRNKQLVGGLTSEVVPENKTSTLSKEAKIKLANEVSVKAQYAGHEASPIVTNAYEDDGGGRANRNIYA